MFCIITYILEKRDFDWGLGEGGKMVVGGGTMGAGKWSGGGL